MPEPDALNRRCSSSPSIPGIRMSRIRHSVSWSAPESKNISAEAKVSTRWPTDLNRVLVESLIDSSSSTTEIKFGSLSVMLHHHYWQIVLQGSCHELSDR